MQKKLNKMTEAERAENARRFDSMYPDWRQSIRRDEEARREKRCRVAAGLRLLGEQGFLDYAQFWRRQRTETDAGVEATEWIVWVQPAHRLDGPFAMTMAGAKGICDTFIEGEHPAPDGKPPAHAEYVAGDPPPSPDERSDTPSPLDVLPY